MRNHVPFFAILMSREDVSTEFKKQTLHILCFVHPIFRFWSFLATKLQKYNVIFVYILQGKWARRKKNRKKNHKTKATRIPKTKRRDEKRNQMINIRSSLHNNYICRKLSQIKCIVILSKEKEKSLRK